VSFSTNCKVDAGYFLESWERYRKVMSRTLVQAVNDKLFMIARQSMWATEKADEKDIARTLGKVTYMGKRKGRRRYSHRLVKAREENAPLIALIIQKRQGPGQGLYGQQMREKIQQVIGARNVSIAYIKSGWLEAIQTLAPHSSISVSNVSNARSKEGARRIGGPKGKADIAKPGDVIMGMITNEAWAKHDKKGAFMRVGTAGLQIGLDKEGKESDKYVQDHIRPVEAAFNRSQK
jgi:hypothetical protein